MRYPNMDKKQLYKLKSEASQLKPVIHIGKSGLTEPVIEELKKQIKANRLVKVKILKSTFESEDTFQFSQKIADATNTTLVDVRGNNVVLYR
jgi:RNA-binding protein